MSQAIIRDSRYPVGPVMAAKIKVFFSAVMNMGSSMNRRVKLSNQMNFGSLKML